MCTYNLQITYLFSVRSEDLRPIFSSFDKSNYNSEQ